MRHIWTYEECLQEAIKYTRRSDFRAESHRAYMAARKYGWLNDICVHMKSREEVANSLLKSDQTLAYQYPDIAKEWNYYRNGNVIPEQVAAHKNKPKFWWTCSVCGYEWESTVNNRTSNNRGCPNCHKGTQTSYPEQIIFFYIKQAFPDAINGYKINGETELDIFIPSRSIGIEYDGEAFHNSPRRIRNDLNKDIIASKENIRLIRFRELGCPNLNSSLSLQIKVKYSPSCQDLGTKLQLLLRHLCLNDSPLINLKRDEATIKASILHLPYEKSFLAYEEDCNTTGTPLKAVWDYEKNEADPSKISPSANMEIHWICPNNPGHRWKTRLYSITTGRSGCPYCAGKHRYSTEEWISRAKEIHGDKFDYSKVLYKSGDEPILIGCPKHGDFMQTPNNHLRSKNGCPLCSTSSNTTLGTEYPELSKMWDGERNQLDFHSSSVLAHSRKKYWWYCTNGKKHSFLAAINEIRSGMNCAVCHGKQVSFDTSLAGMHPELLPLWSSENEISPDKVSVGSDAKYIWICEKHGPYKAMIRHQIEGRCCCPQCNNHKLTPDQYKERLSVKHPHIELLTDYEKMSVKIRYRCLICGNTSSIRPQDLERRGCSKCHNNPE